MLKLAGEFIEGQLADHLAELDAHLKGGITDILRTGEYSHFLPGTIRSATLLLTANVLYAHAFLVPRDITVDRIAVDVQALAASKSLRLGIYNNGTNLYPGSLLLDAGTVSVNTTGVKAVTIDRALTKGLYWLAMVGDGTPSLDGTYPHLNVLGHLSTNFAKLNTGWEVAHTYGVLPDPYTAGGSFSDKVLASIALRIASLD